MPYIFLVPKEVACTIGFFGTHGLIMRLFNAILMLCVLADTSSCFFTSVSAPERRVSSALSLHKSVETPESAAEKSMVFQHQTITRKGMLVRSTAVLSSILSNPFTANADTPTSIQSCPKGTGNSKVNCASTAAVRQVDNYIEPWTYPSSMPVNEVIARLKGAVSTDIHNTIVEQNETYLKVEAVRNFSTDMVEFLVNPEDHIVTFISRQTDGPDFGDFGANRKRLNEIRRKARVFDVMGGQGYARESALGQLKAFYGLQSGAGFEDVILDLDN